MFLLSLSQVETTYNSNTILIIQNTILIITCIHHLLSDDCHNTYRLLMTLNGSINCYNPQFSSLV